MAACGAGAATGEIRRIGALMPFAKDDREDQLRRAALQHSLQQLGWFEGRNIHIEYRWFGGEPARRASNGTGAARN